MALRFIYEGQIALLAIVFLYIGSACLQIHTVAFGTVRGAGGGCKQACAQHIQCCFNHILSFHPYTLEFIPEAVTVRRPQGKPTSVAVSVGGEL